MTFDTDAFRRAALSDPLARDIWEQKYRLPGETDVDATRARVVNAVYAQDPDVAARAEAMELVQGGYLIPAGRINAGAGSPSAVTLINCFVSETVQDSMPGIQQMIARAALTMQQGGGIGTDYSTVRPAGARVGRTGSVASGAISFAMQQDAMCRTIVSGGSRRGAMMMTLRDDHPDLWHEDQLETRTDPHTGEVVLRNPSFISAKRQRGALTQFNVSVLVSDAFMAAVAADADWDLGFHVPRADGKHVEVYDRPFPYDTIEMSNEFRAVGAGIYNKGERCPWFVYTRVKARRLWEDLLRSAYTYAEPGIIFIDHVNARNNLRYCEEISATNPCGEQPLPPHGICCLGSVNTAFMVVDPFTSNARLDTALFEHTVRAGIRFLDNVLDTTSYPLAAQREEALAKRRIGLGITGWGDALLQLGVAYGSQDAVEFTEQMAVRLRDQSYLASAALARERGPFPRYDRHGIEAGWTFRHLGHEAMEAVHEYGLRNGCLNTIAPNGTISVYVGNVSSGLEPVYAFEKTMRKVRQPDGGTREYESVDYALRLYEAIHGATPRESLPSYFVGALNIAPAAHVRMQAAWQHGIDAAVSKTVNCATSMTFEEFRGIYDLAYETGCKGCTTYRYDPAAGRGAVLSVAEPASVALVEAAEPKPDFTAEAQDWRRPRPRALCGRTYKVKWPLTGVNYYITVTHDAAGVPRELFVASRDTSNLEWVQALTCAVTAILRRGGDFRFMLEELRQVSAATGGAFLQLDASDVHPERYPSIVAAIGGVLAREFGAAPVVETEALPGTLAATAEYATRMTCPECGRPALIREDGCHRCLDCGYNRCG
jgi:ribonucleoside-diphosphate reductase alpha chain